MSVELVPRTQSSDIGGFGVFSHGDSGAAHVMAHRILDEERHELGHRLLGAWLDCHDGVGSDWTHLQWHMAVFEIAVGQWEHAFARFKQKILPVATSSNDALTDAPALLWRLWLTAPGNMELPWEPVRSMALRHLGELPCAYVELHCLLALAGARDVEALSQWLRVKRPCKDDHTRLLVRLALGLRALAASDYARAASVLDGEVPRISELGGSHAQNLLFADIVADCWRRAEIHVAA